VAVVLAATGCDTPTAPRPAATADEAPRIKLSAVEQNERVPLTFVVQVEREGGNDAEVAVPAPQPPEEVRVLVFGGADQVAVGRDHVGRAEVVGHQALLPGQIAQPAGV
jgi:hypothetical protein